MTFTRRDSRVWHREVPGARWFKADLHIHTMDDLAGGRARFPPGIHGPAESIRTIDAYARRFLQSAVEKRVRVLGVTPHSPRVGVGAETSAVWRIVDEWNAGVDDDGTPFREKIYAVFPGFEPSLKQGKSGLHLLYLFDPEIGRNRYLRAFDVVMGGVSPWRNNELQLSNHDAEAAFRALQEFRAQECPKTGDGEFSWSYLALAPHIENEKGLLGAQKAQVLARFRHGAVAGLELGDEKLPEDTEKGRPWLKGGMAEHHQAFFHSSDAYSVDDIGERHTWFKLASPRIEALRQAFIASDSRMRIAFERNADGALTEISNAPDVTVNERPWLKSVTVKGRASFFGDRGDKEESRFDLSPDLTCIIGGSMTGKSTFLDGLRVHVGAEMPQDDGLKSQVEARGRQRFLAGSPEITLECPGQDPSAPPLDRWRAVFHAQNELQRLAQESGAVKDILARLVASETDDIQVREERSDALDRELRGLVKRLAKLDESLADAEQAFERARSAAMDLHAFSDAGIDDLHRTSRDLRNWQGTVKAGNELAASLDRVLQSTESLDVPEIDDDLAQVLRAVGAGERQDGFRHLADGQHELSSAWEGVVGHLRSAKDELAGANAFTTLIASVLESHDQVVRVDLNRRLAARGVDGARIKEFEALSRRASLLASYEANFNRTRAELEASERSFQALLADRQRLIDQQRAAFDRVIDAVHAEFDGRIRTRRIDHGDRKPLADFLKGLAQKGVTRWWNELADQKRPSPQELRDALDSGQLVEAGMSEAVQKTFCDAMNRSKRRELASIPCRDRYVLELRMDDGSHRRLDDLSGGQRVSVLLSLLLETNDDRPLVIDQPEDELDNRFLFDTVLPALKRLKGRRQIIVATHDANIVVNGDADQVIQLEATANRGRVAQAGAIEEPPVRDAIVRTVDGGDEAFRLRRLKYGF